MKAINNSLLSETTKIQNRKITKSRKRWNNNNKTTAQPPPRIRLVRNYYRFTGLKDTFDRYLTVRPSVLLSIFLASSFKIHLVHTYYIFYMYSYVHLFFVFQFCPYPYCVIVSLCVYMFCCLCVNVNVMSVYVFRVCVLRFLWFLWVFVLFWVFVFVVFVC